MFAYYLFFFPSAILQLGAAPILPHKDNKSSWTLNQEAVRPA